MFEPMFINQPGIFGIPASLAITGFGLALGLAGAVWALRLTAGEPDPDSFRATRPDPHDYRPVMVGSGVGILAVLGAWLTVTNNWSLFL